MGGFYKLDGDLQRDRQSSTTLYPDLVSAKDAVQHHPTEEGRPVYYIKLSDNPNVNEDEPTCSTTR